MIKRILTVPVLIVAFLSSFSQRHVQFIISSVPPNGDKILWFVFDDLHDLAEIPARLFCTNNVLTFVGNAHLRVSGHILTCATRYIIYNNRKWRMSIQHFVMLENPFLVRFV